MERLFRNVLGYKVNVSKSAITGFKIVSSRMRSQLSSITTVPWVRCIKYLGIKLGDSLDPKMLIELNLKPIINFAQKQFVHW